MRIKILSIISIFAFFIGVNKSHAQGIAVKTNLAGWAALAPNVGVDLCVSESSSLEAIFYKSATDCWLKSANFTALQLGYRYWFDREPLNSFFCGVTATPTRYEVKINDKKRKGDCIPFGVNVGYCLPIGQNLNFEISYGIGVTYLFEDIYSNNDLNEQNSYNRHKLSLSPTNIGINISYIIK